jgi:dolichol kinase
MIGQDAMVLQHRRLLDDLYRLIQTLDPATFRSELSSAAEEMMESLKGRVNELLENHPMPEKVKIQLQTLRDSFEQWKPKLPFPPKEEWQYLFKRLQPAYESMAQSLRERNLQVPVLRQTNYRRNLFHAFNGLIALMIIQYVAVPWMVQLLISLLFGAALVMEIGRRTLDGWNEKLMVFFGPIAHPHEAHKVNSATWYLCALTLLAFTVNPLAQSIAVVILGLADPAAGMVGRRFGTRKLVGNKSWVGTSAFLVVGFLTALCTLRLYYGHLDMNTMLIIAGAGTLSGGVAELFTMELDDNFTIPLIVGIVIAATLALL